MALPDRSWSQIRPSLAMKSHPRFIETRAAVGNVSRQGRRALFAVGRDVRQAGLVDYENVHKIDLSNLDESYRGGCVRRCQSTAPRTARQPATAHRFSRVNFLQHPRHGRADGIAVRIADRPQ